MTTPVQAPIALRTSVTSARAGGSVILDGSFLLLRGALCGPGFDTLLPLFPLPLLGVMLLFESLALRCFLRDTAGAGSDFAVALLVGVLAAFLPYGFLIAMVTGTLGHHLAPRVHLGFIGEMSK